MPTTKVGKRAATWFGSSIGLFTVLILAYNTDLLGDVFEQRTAGGLALWLAAAVATVVTLATSLTALIRDRDRSVAVIVAAVVSLLMTALLAIGAIPEN